jgi:hypothetical protein
MTERPSHLVAGLIAKRRELAGIIAGLERQLAQHRADLTHIDGVLRVLAANIVPNRLSQSAPIAAACISSVTNFLVSFSLPLEPPKSR